jgi:hypothetical protein
LFDEGMITKAAIDAGHVLIENGICGTVFEEIQEKIRVRLRDIPQIDFGDDFVHVAHGSIQRMLENYAVGCARFDASYSLALIEAPPVLLDYSCVFIVFPHQISVQVLNYITGRSVSHFGGSLRQQVLKNLLKVKVASTGTVKPQLSCKI